MLPTLRRKGDWFLPEPTANVPYPQRVKWNQDFWNDNPTPDMVQRLSSPDPVYGNENRGQYTETPATLAKQRASTSTSAPTTSKSSGVGGSLPSTSSMPEAAQLQAFMRSFK